MKIVLCVLSAALRCVVAQNAFVALQGGPSPPASIVAPTPTPLANAAVWQEAVAIDTAKNLSGTNQFIYSQIAWWQSLENSSNSYPAGSSSIDGGSTISQLLQVLQTYPVRFDQAQASDPKRTPSKYDLAELLGNPWSDAMP